MARKTTISCLIFVIILSVGSASYASPYDITGIWVFTTSNNWASHPWDCPAADNRTSVAEVTQTGNQVSVLAEGKTYTGTVSGNTYTFTHSYLESGGTATETITVTPSSATAGSGTFEWVWTDGWFTCSGGADLTIVKQVAGPARNITGMWQYQTHSPWVEGGCALDPPQTGITAVQQNANAFTYIDEYGIHTGRVSGDNYHCTISYYEEGGITTQTVYFSMLSDTSATGTVIWTWTDGIWQCSGGSQLSLAKATAGPTYDAGGQWTYAPVAGTYQEAKSDASATCAGAPASGPVTMTQDDREFRLAGYQGIQAGFITGITYVSIHSYPLSDGTTTEVLAFDLATGGQATSYGFSLRVWTDGDHTCYTRNELTLAKTAVSNSRPAAPPLLSPANNAQNQPLTPVLQIGFFSDPDSGDYQKDTEWEISTTDDFFNPVLASVTDRHLLALEVPKFILKEGTSYFWRARTYDQQGRASPWSSVRTFQTVVLNADANNNGIPDSQEVGSQVDTDGNGVFDNVQNDIKSVDSIVGSGPIGISRKYTTSLLGINSVESIDPDTISPVSRPYNMGDGMIAVDMSVFKPIDDGKLRIYLPSTVPAGAKWFMYDSVKGWVDYSQFVTFGASRDYVDIRLMDWGHGDADDLPNGDVIDPGGWGLEAFIRGMVKDLATQAGIDDATLTIPVASREDLVFSTLNDGSFLGMIVPGSYSMTVSAPGYRSRTLSSIDVAAAEFTVLDDIYLDRMGDADQDGDTDLADAILCLQIISGLPVSAAVHPETDVMQDGKMGLEDAIFIIQSISGNR